MEIVFATTDLQEVCENEKKMKKKFGCIQSLKLKTRLAELRAAKCVGELVTGHPHPLDYKRSGQFSVSLWKGWRLIFESGNNPILRTSDNSVDWHKVTIVNIFSIEDYHD